MSATWDIDWRLDMDFTQRLAAFRKERRLSQRTLAERLAAHVREIHCYSSDNVQRTLNETRRVAKRTLQAGGDR